MKSLVVQVAAGRPGKKDVPEVGPTYRNIKAKDGFIAQQDISSLWELFESSVKRFPGSHCPRVTTVVFWGDAAEVKLCRLHPQGRGRASTR
ncbi:hypothetical protein WJX72_006087 [[Myrmecia] bisecta]|uniref:Uncharacterized protein n=1 Tax=[Myrmecia] bisecta TaxID=41462 RepID=A0AAW1PT92_9CHLO